MIKEVKKLKVVKNIDLNKDYFLLELKSDKQMPEIYPGQFAEVKINDSETTFLRRPFSIHDINKENNTLSLYIKAVGDGTKKLKQIEENNYVDIVYPLGNGFSVVENLKVLIVGGGIGAAPFLILAKELNKKNNKVDILIGGRTKEDILRIDEYEKYGNLFISTDDGTLGEKGLVINNSIINKIKEYDIIYCCGPDKMMQAVAKIAKENNIKCEVSLENTMACGFGVCLCCVTETVDGNQCVCTEGPVFSINKLKW